MNIYVATVNHSDGDGDRIVCIATSPELAMYVLQADYPTAPDFRLWDKDVNEWTVTVGRYNHYKIEGVELLGA